MNNKLDDRTKTFALKILNQFCKTLPQTEEEIFQKYGQFGIDILNIHRNYYNPKQAQQDLDNKSLEDLDKTINEIMLHGKRF
jgi:uncharacterized protein YaaN involved in tellurite resistance